MKIGRNDPCPCNSGKKYKKCCMRKTEEQKMAEAFADIQPIIKKQGHIKQCLHPNKAECKGDIIRAHAIQNNRILNRIAENGYVTMLDGSSFLIFKMRIQKGEK